MPLRAKSTFLWTASWYWPWTRQWLHCEVLWTDSAEGTLQGYYQGHVCFWVLSAIFAGSFQVSMARLSEVWPNCVPSPAGLAHTPTGSFLLLHSVLWVPSDLLSHLVSSSHALSWTEEPGQLQFMGLQRVGHDLAIKQQPFLWRVHLSLGGDSLLHFFLP